MLLKMGIGLLVCFRCPFSLPEFFGFFRFWGRSVANNMFWTVLDSIALRKPRDAIVSLQGEMGHGRAVKNRILMWCCGRKCGALQKGFGESRRQTPGPWQHLEGCGLLWRLRKPI